MKSSYTLKLIVLLLFWILSFLTINAQSRINFNNQNLFMSGANVGWISFANDFGPSSMRIADFKNYFKQFSEAGGNSIRIWMHTTGANTPAFSSDGMVTGPGNGMAEDIKAILDAAWEYKVGLMLCLWSFDMQRKTIGTSLLARTKKILMDSVATRSYINNALIPMVQAAKGHPALLSWEVFNEPEGMSIEFGWKDITTCEIPMFNIQRFTNMVAGAIHRTDPNAKVTNGAWSFYAMTDMNYASKVSQSLLFDGLSIEEKQEIQKQINEKYNVDLSVEQIKQNFVKTLANSNYYRDDRLIAAGNDQKGTLDFYCVHYYASNFGTGLSPFHHPYKDWGLDKPLIVAEFKMEDSRGVKYQDLFTNLIKNGYAGAMTWYWDYPTDNARTREQMKTLYENYPYDVVVDPKSGVIYSFKTNKGTINKGEEVTLEWKASVGSTVKLNDETVEHKGSKVLKPTTTGTITLTASGELTSAKNVFVEVIPSGKILSFKALQNPIAAGETSTLVWETSTGSTVTINGQSVSEDGTMEVKPQSNPTTYTLETKGEISDKASVDISLVPVGQVNRAMGRVVTVSSVLNNDPSNTPDLAIDGNYFTSWTSENVEPQWIQIDLAKSYLLSKIVVSWGTAFAKTYRIGVSNDLVNWTLLKTSTTGVGGYEELNGLNATGRYFKMFCDKKGTSSNFSVSEIEIYGVPTSVDVDENKLPVEFSLMQNFPNPFNPSTTIRYQISELSYVSLKVFDVLGNEVATLVNEVKQPGFYNSQFSILNSQLSSGVYFYKLTAGNFSETKKMLVIK